jgi:hypothetical protein
MAVASTSPHSAQDLLEVTIMVPRSYAVSYSMRVCTGEIFDVM